MFVRSYIHHCARLVDAYRRSYARARHPISKRSALYGMTLYLIHIDRTLQHA